MRLALVALLLALTTLLLPGRAQAADGTEVVVVIDTSYSMGRSYPWGGQQRPPSDPDRRAQLAALILEGLVRGTDDRLTIVPMHGPTIQAGEPDAIRDMRLASATPYLGALGKAREILEASPRTDRLLVFVTDGMPTDYSDPARGPSILGTDRSPMPFDTVALGVLPGQADGELPRSAMEFLRNIVHDPSDAVRVRRSEDLVDAVTSAWARALGSKPESGRLTPGESHTVRVGKYVTEVLVAVAGDGPTGPFVAGLTTSQGEQEPDVTGDNGCERCEPPAIHYATWRLPHDPTLEDQVTLRLDRGRGDITYGVILRYDLAARIELPDQAIAGTPVEVRGWLSFRGTRVDDEAFFADDGFTATAVVGEQQVELTHQGEGWFSGTVEAPLDAVDSTADVELRFRNDWMEERTRAGVQVVRPPQLDATASVLDLGTWPGERGPTERCGEITLTGDRPEGMALAPTFVGVPEGMVLGVTPLGPDGEALDHSDTDRFRVCARAPGCCGDLRSSELTAVTFSVDHPLVEGEPVRAPVSFHVQPTGFLTCWWPWILAAVLLALLLFILVGILRGHDFDPDLTVRVAGSERQLSRATAVVLREQPRGRRGFYRNARVCLTTSGEFVAHPRRAAVHVEAVKGGARFHIRAPLERKDRRTRKMVPVTEEEALDGPTPGVVYHCGGLWLRFE